MNIQINQLDESCEMMKENTILRLVSPLQSGQLQLDIQEDLDTSRYVRFLKPTLAEENKKIAIALSKHLLETQQIKKDEAKVIAKCLSCEDTLLKMVDGKSDSVFFSKLLTVDSYDNMPYLIVFLNNAIKLIQLRSLLGIESIHEKLAFDLFAPTNAITPQPVCSLVASKVIYQNNYIYTKKAA